MKESMVIYESAYRAISYLPDEKLQLEAYRGLMEYGFYGIVPESENPFVNMIFVQAIPSMRSAKERYDASVENGKKGGRPTEVQTEDIIKMKQSGMTNKQIAEKLGCSEKNIEKRITVYNRAHPTNPTNPPTIPPTNLTVSDTVTDTESETEPSTATVTESASFAASDLNQSPEDKETGFTDSTKQSVADDQTSVSIGSESTLYELHPSGEVTPAGHISDAERRESEEYYFQGDWRKLPDETRKSAGRRIRDLTNGECGEIVCLIEQGEPHQTIEKRYGMRSGSITGDFQKNRTSFVMAYMNGKVPRRIERAAIAV